MFFTTLIVAGIVLVVWAVFAFLCGMEQAVNEMETGKLDICAQPHPLSFLFLQGLYWAWVYFSAPITFPLYCWKIRKEARNSSH